MNLLLHWSSPFNLWPQTVLCALLAGRLMDKVSCSDHIIVKGAYCNKGIIREEAAIAFRVTKNRTPHIFFHFNYEFFFQWELIAQKHCTMTCTDDFFAHG